MKRAMQTLAAYAGVFVVLFAMAVVGGIESGELLP
jgi:hypothetical protein